MYLRTEEEEEEEEEEEGVRVKRSSGRMKWECGVCVQKNKLLFAILSSEHGNDFG